MPYHPPESTGAENFSHPADETARPSAPFPPTRQQRPQPQPPTAALAEALVWTAGLMGGALGVLILSGTAPMRTWRHKSAPARMRQADAPVDSTFARVCRAVAGQSKRQVASLLGPPPTASLGASGLSDPAAPALGFWQANTWYYPFDYARRSAIAIRFDQGRAAKIDFIDGPT